MDSVNLTDNFLIAMPTLEDPYFSHALVYICEHNEHGALGIIVNRPIDMNLAGLFEKIDIKLEADSLANLPVYFGGPVQLDRGFVLHRPVGQWQSTLAINSEIGLTVRATCWHRSAAPVCRRKSSSLSATPAGMRGNWKTNWRRIRG